MPKKIKAIILERVSITADRLKPSREFLFENIPPNTSRTVTIKLKETQPGQKMIITFLRSRGRRVRDVYYFTSPNNVPTIPITLESIHWL